MISSLCRTHTHSSLTDKKSYYNYVRTARKKERLCPPSQVPKKFSLRLPQIPIHSVRFQIKNEKSARNNLTICGDQSVVTLKDSSSMDSSLFSTSSSSNNSSFMDSSGGGINLGDSMDMSKF